MERFLPLPIAALAATTFEFLPERVNLVSLIVQGASLVGLLGLALAVVVRTRPRWRRHRLFAAPVEHFTLAGAGLAILLFTVAWVIQKVD